MDLRHLRYVLAAVDCGSFRQAAQALGVKQSAISRRVRDLEDEIGVALFIRGHSGVQLTPAGARFAGRTRKVLAQIRGAVIDAASHGRGETGIVRIGIFSSLASGFLPDLLRTYVEANSAVRLNLIEGSPPEHIAAIRRYNLDIAFLTGRPPADSCDLAHLWNERVFVVLPTDDVLSRKAEIVWEDLRDRHFIVSESDPGPEIHDYLVKHLADLGSRPNIDRQAVGRDNLMVLVALGQGLTLTSEATIEARFPAVVFRPLRDEVLPFCAIWSPQNDNPALRRLLSLAKLMARRSPPGAAWSLKASGTAQRVDVEDRHALTVQAPIGRHEALMPGDD